jgi:hypothetical protein
MRNRFNLLLNKESDISRIAATGFIWLAKRATQYNDSQPATSPVKRSGRLSAAKERGKLMKWTIAKSLPQKSGFTSGHAGAGIALPGGNRKKGHSVENITRAFLKLMWRLERAASLASRCFFVVVFILGFSSSYFVKPRSETHPQHSLSSDVENDPPKPAIVQKIRRSLTHWVETTWFGCWKRPTS